MCTFYANSLTFKSVTGVTGILEAILPVLEQDCGDTFDIAKILEGVGCYRTPTRATIESTRVLPRDADDSDLLSIRYTRRDNHVWARRWITEISLCAAAPHDEVRCSIQARFEDGHLASPHVTKIAIPDIVKALLRTFDQVDIRSDARPIALDETNAESYRLYALSKERQERLIVISPSADGELPPELDEFMAAMTGVIRFVILGSNSAGRSISHQIGREICAHDGYINIIEPIRADGRIRRQCFPSTTAEALHRVQVELTNMDSWRRRIGFISIERAQAHYFERQGDDEQLEAAVKELDEARAKCAALEKQIARMASKHRAMQVEIGSLRAKVHGEKVTKASPATNGDTEAESIAQAPSDELLLAFDDGLETGLRKVQDLYADRVVVLPSAISSARRSDRSGFRHRAASGVMMKKLVSEYHTALSQGRTDYAGIEIFGRSGYSAKERDGLSDKGRARRSFDHNGKKMLMERHLRIGVKDTAADTLRVHFDWLAHEGKIVIGYCGAHLDF